MTLKLSVPKTETNLTPQITVIGVGGAGGNAVNNMIQTELSGVEFLVANTDAQAIGQSLCKRCIQLGRGITQGLGAGARPDVGRAAAEEALEEILSELEGANMLFITAGMGGGTGTGGGPVIARAAREAGILTVGVVTKPFHFEGVHRMRLAESGIAELTQYVDTLIVIPNQNLFRVANEKTTFADAFKMADDVLDSGVRGVTDLMVLPGLINLDFADIRSVMTEMGKAMMGTGEAEGENRALAAAEAAISNPLLDDVSMKGARGVLINITGASDMTLFEVDQAANRIRDEVDPEANIIFGSTFNEELEGRMRVAVVATGIETDAVAAPRPVALSLVATQNDAAASRASVASAGASTASAGASVGVAATPVDTQDQMLAQANARQHEPADRKQAAAGAGAAAASPSVVAAVADARERGSLYSYSKAVALAVGDDAKGTEAVAELPAELPIRPVTASAGGPNDRSPAPAAPADRAEMGSTVPLAVQSKAKPTGAGSGDPDSIAPAAAANGSLEPPSAAQSATTGSSGKRPKGLFAKVTSGATRALQAAAQLGEHQEPSPGAPDPARRTPQPSAGKETPEPTAPAAKPTAKPTAEPRLAGLDSAERVGARNSEEDLLDIPAFLRRQAN